MWHKRLVFFGVTGIIVLLAVGLQSATDKLAGQSPLLAPVFRPPPPNLSPIPLEGINVPEGIKICLAQSGERFDRSGVVEEQGKTFYLLSIYNNFTSQDPLFTQDELIALSKEQGCLRLIQPGTLKPLSVYLSESKARELELQRFRHWIEQAGGKQEFESSLAAQINPPNYYYLSAEQVWALEQLGIQFPDAYLRLRSDTFSDPDEVWRKELLKQY